MKKLTLHLGILVIAARGVGLLVPLAMAARFGVTDSTDALYYAAGVPAFLLIVATSALSTALIPQLARDPSLSSRPIALRVGAIALLVGAFEAWLLPHWLSHGTDFSPLTQRQASDFAWMLLPYLSASAAGAVLRAGCEAQNRLRQAVVGPAIRAGTTLTGVLLVPELSYLPMVMGLGAALEALWYGWGQAGHRDPGWAVPGAGRVMVGEGLVAANGLVDRAFAGLLTAGSVSVLEYGDRLRLIPLAFFEAVLVTPLYSAWARLPPDQLRGAWWGGIKRSLLVLPVLIGMAVLAPWLVSLAYGRGAFEKEAEVTSVLLAFLPGVWLSIVGGLGTRVLVLRKQFGAVLTLGGVSFLLNTALNAALSPGFGVAGLALATTLTSLGVVVGAGVMIARSG